MNWKEFYQTGINNTTNVAISGGGEKSSFHLSYGFTKTKGVFLNNDFHRHNISFRGITELNRIFSMELSVKYAFSSAKNGASQGGWDWGQQCRHDDRLPPASKRGHRGLLQAIPRP